MKPKRVLGIFLIILGIFNLMIFSFIALPKDYFSFQKEDRTGFVSKVIDGDTVVINGETVRLLGIDTDEKGSPCFTAAKNRIGELILNKEVILEKGKDDRDVYGRLLRYIFLDNKNIDLQMIKEGLAVARFPDSENKYQEEFIDAEQIARENQIGCKWQNYTNSPTI